MGRFPSNEHTARMTGGGRAMAWESDLIAVSNDDHACHKSTKWHR